MQQSAAATILLTAITILGTVVAGFSQRANDRPPRDRDAVRPGSEPRPQMQEEGYTFLSMRLTAPTDFRTIDASGNNLQNHDWGKADTELARLSDAAYEDGAHSPSGADRPNARLISNAVAAQSEPTTNSVGATDFLWQWGQFIDHDIDLTPEIEPEESFDIPVPFGDPQFDPFFTGTNSIPLHRAFYREVNGVREQVNDITAYIDGSMIYGSDDARALELRANDGTGRLAISDGDLLPFNLNGFANAPSAQMTTLFLAGDVRANEQTYLMSMHTLFVREHNSMADELRATNPDLDGDTIYELARMIVVAELQAITYNEFLPILLGNRALDPYSGYDPEVRADIANTFSTAAFRFGHTMLPTQLLRLDSDNNEIASGHLTLASAFFRPGEVIAEGIEPYLRGLAGQEAQEIDNMLVDDVRNFLFGPPGAGGLDLATLNIQRGRDHGLPDLNQLRLDLGLNSYRSFAELNPDPAVNSRIASVYSDVDLVDPWVGILAEPKVRGSMLGETGTRILGDQFTALRDGDRYFYRAALPEQLVEYIETQTLAEIIRRNTDIGDEIQDNVFIIGDTEMRPGITRMRMDDQSGEADFRWNSVPGDRYRVRSSTDLLHWNDVDPDCRSEGWSTEFRVPGAQSRNAAPEMRFFTIEAHPRP